MMFILAKKVSVTGNISELEYVLKEGLDLELMYQDMFLASEGYVYRMQQEGNFDVDKMVDDYRRIINF